jgi:hypothetical protein
MLTPLHPFISPMDRDHRCAQSSYVRWAIHLVRLLALIVQRVCGSVLGSLTLRCPAGLASQHAVGAR